MPKVNVAIVVGSNRRQSINRKLALALAKLGDGKLTAKFVQIDDLPIYNQDLEDPLPASVGRFKAEIEQRRRAAVRHAGAQSLHSRPSSRTPSTGARGPTGRTHGRESLLPSPAPRPARLQARSPSSICVRFWATWACSCWAARPTSPSSRG